LEDRNNFRPNTVNQLTASTFIGHENSTNASSAKIYIEVSEMEEEKQQQYLVQICTKDSRIKDKNMKIK